MPEGGMNRTKTTPMSVVCMQSFGIINISLFSCKRNIYDSVSDKGWKIGAQKGYF